MMVTWSYNFACLLYRSLVVAFSRRQLKLFEGITAPQQRLQLWCCWGRDWLERCFCAADDNTCNGCDDDDDGNGDNGNDDDYDNNDVQVARSSKDERWRTLWRKRRINWPCLTKVGRIAPTPSWPLLLLRPFMLLLFMALFTLLFKKKLACKNGPLPPKKTINQQTAITMNKQLI